MKNTIEKINALIERATHKSTPIEEARSCAMLAVSLIKQNEYIVANPHNVVTNNSGNIHNNDDCNYYSQQEVNFDPSDFTEELKPFNTVISRSGGICKKCGKEIIANTVVAEATEFTKQGFKEKTHYQCRRYFIDGK